MKLFRLSALMAGLLGAACSAQPQALSPVGSETSLEIRPVSLAAPNGRLTLQYAGEENPALTLRTGASGRLELGQVAVPSRASWAPDSRRFYVNDSGSASWSTFRVWLVNEEGEATESSRAREAAISELGRLNGCASVPEPDATTHGMGWSGDGSRVYLLVEVRRQSGDCIWKDTDYILVVADAATGRLHEVLQEGDARRAYPTLPWAPVTAP